MITTTNLYHPHPLGWIHAQFTSHGLRMLTLPVTAPGPEPAPDDEPSAVAESFRAALARYFAGASEDFTGIPLDLSGSTPFQHAVWTAARGVRWGAHLYLRGLGRASWAHSGIRARRGTRPWRQPHRHRNPVPSLLGREWRPRRLRRRTPLETGIIAVGRRAVVLNAGTPKV